MASGEIVARCKRSARFWRAWVETGSCDDDAEVETVFGDAELRERLASPLRHYEVPAGGSSASTLALTSASSAGTNATPMPEKIAASAKKATDDLGIAPNVAENLVRLYADSRLAGLSKPHDVGIDALELVDFDAADIIGELQKLLHSERCEALQVLAAVLRSAIDASHPFASHCRKLSRELLQNGLGKQLWQIYQEVSSVPGFSVHPERAEVVSCVRQGLDLQLCVLECTIFAHYDPDLSSLAPETLCRSADIFLRQRFLGSLMKAAQHHPWLCADPDICTRAQRVGDLCLAILIQGLALEDIDLNITTRSPQKSDFTRFHPILGSVEYVQHLHKRFSTEWVDVCQCAVDDRGHRQTSPETKHAARAASLVVLAWSALIGAAPAEYREIHGLGFSRLAASAAFKSPSLVVDAVRGISDRRFLLTETLNRHHSAAKLFMRSLVAAVGKSFQLDTAIPAVHLAMSELAAAIFDGSSGHIAQEFWTSEYSGRNGSFFVLQGWLSNFPSGLDAMLRLVGSLSGSNGDNDAGHPASRYALELLRAPLNSLLLPFNLMHSVVEVSASAGQLPASVLLRDPVYVEELVLRSLRLVVPEWHLPRCAVLRPGAVGTLLDGTQHKVRWELKENQTVSVLRIAALTWDSTLETLGWTRNSSNDTATGISNAEQMLLSVLGCVCRLLIANPEEMYIAINQEFPAEEGADGRGLLVRLIVSTFACAEMSDSAAHRMLPLLLGALGACTSCGNPVVGAAAPAYSLLLQLLGGQEHFRFKIRTVEQLMEVFTAAIGRERQVGAYPITLSAVQFCSSLLRTCSAELVALPLQAHGALPFIEGSATPIAQHGLSQYDKDEEGTPKRQIEVLGAFLDFVFCSVFAKCAFWPFQAQARRWQVIHACIDVGMYILQALECFNWPVPVAVAASGRQSGSRSGTEQICQTLHVLREVQFRILRSWSEGAFVLTLLQTIYCDLHFSPVSEVGQSKFVGFQDTTFNPDAFAHTGAAELDDVALPGPIDGAQMLGSALKCFHGVLALTIGPSGSAPLLAPLVKHLVEVTSQRDPRVNFVEAVPSRANLIQSLYTHICSDQQEVAQWACSALASVCALWRLGPGVPASDCRTQLGGTRQTSPFGKSPGNPPLLAFLSTPATRVTGAGMDSTLPPLPAIGSTPTTGDTSCWPDLLSTSLATRLLEVLSDQSWSVDARSAFVDVCRATLDCAPGLFLESGETIIPQCVKACAQALADLVVSAAAALPKTGSKGGSELVIADGSGSDDKKHGAMPDDGDCGRFIVVVLSFLDDLARVHEEVQLTEFSKQLEVRPNKFQTMWEVLSDVVSLILRPWSKTGSFPWSVIKASQPGCAEVFLAVSAIYRVADRACGAAALEPTSSFCSLLKLLFSADSTELWIPRAEPPPNDRTESNKKRAKNSSIIEPAFFSDGGIFGDAGSFQHPFGKMQTLGRSAQAVPAGETKSFAVFERCRNSADRFHALLAKYQLRSDLIVPSVADGASILAQENRFVPRQLRAWADLCQVACGSALDDLPIGQGRARMRDALPAEKLGVYGTVGGVGSSSSGCAVVDAYVLGGPLRGVHQPSLRLAMASIGALKVGDQASLQDLGDLLAETEQLFHSQRIISARVLSIEAFTDLVHAISRQRGSSSDNLHDLLSGLTREMVQQLTHVLSHVDLLEDNAPLLARAIRLMTHLIAVPPYTAHVLGKTEVLAPFSVLDGGPKLKAVDEMKKMFEHETAIGTVLIRQLTALLHACATSLQQCGSLPPQADQFTRYLDPSKGVPDVAYAAVSLLMFLVPAFAKKSEESHLPDLALLFADLLQVLSEVLAVVNKSEATSRTQFAEVVALSATTGQLKRPGDVSQLDHVVKCGFHGLLSTLVERVLSVLRNTSSSHELGAHGLDVIRKYYLPQVLSTSCGIFCPSSATSAERPAVSPVAARMESVQSIAGAEDIRRAAAWERALEAADACRLDGTLSVLLSLAQTAEGSVILAEQQSFLLLAYCPLLHAVVLPDRSTGKFPLAYARPGAGAAAVSPNAGAPWRRPLHATWCKTLLLVATMLASAPQLAKHANVFIEAYAPRLRHVLTRGLQNGHLAILEEATIACRTLALVAQNCALAENLLAETAAPALTFVIGSCLAERSSPSEVFVPVATAERLAANIPADSEGSPAEVPSIYHQRIGFLALELLRNLLVALLRVASSPNWLSNAPTGISKTDAAAQAVPPGVWPTAQSVFGLKPQPGASGTSLGLQDSSSVGPLRQWAAVMDATLEGARRVLDVMEALHKKQHADMVLVAAAGIGRLSDARLLVPLSLALAPLEQVVDISEFSLPGPACPGSPGFLARGLAPLGSKSPRALAAGLSPPNSPVLTGSPSASRRRRAAILRAPGPGLCFKFMALRPFSSVGGQLAVGIVPEYVTFKEIRSICGTILEMSCTLLCHFCQATRSSILVGGAERSVPGSSVLHGLLSFLHEMLSSAPLGSPSIDGPDVEFFAELDAALRSWQNLGPSEVENRLADPPAWALPAAAV